MAVEHLYLLVYSKFIKKKKLKLNTVSMIPTYRKKISAQTVTINSACNPRFLM